MGEIADMMLEGSMCQYCGVWMDSTPGYPQTCAGCIQDEFREERQATQREKVPCPDCGKMVASCGMEQHRKAKHDE